MSLEAAIKENTEAVRILAAALNVGRNTLGGSTSAPAAKAPDAPAAAPKAAEKAPETGTTLTYEKDIKPIALALAKSNRQALLDIYKKLNVTVGTEIKPEQFADAKKLIDAALAPTK
jgi:hypothetical protein